MNSWRALRIEPHRRRLSLALWHAAPTVQKFEIAECTDPDYKPMIPQVIVLQSGFAIYKVDNGDLVLQPSDA